MSTPPNARTFVILSSLALLMLVGCGDDTTSTETVTATEASTSATSSTITTSIDPALSTTTGSEEGSPPAADVVVTKLTGFMSPSGNIGCYIDRRSVRCDIAERDWKAPPKPARCDLDFGQGISLDAGGTPSLVCAGDTALGGGEQLPYGQSIGAGLLRCESEEAGMSCSDTETGRGFTISQESYELR